MADPNAEIQIAEPLNVLPEITLSAASEKPPPIAKANFISTVELDVAVKGMANMKSWTI